MNWKEEVAEKLQRYPAMVRAAKAIPLELEALEQEACGLQAVRMGSTGVRNSRANEERLMNIFVRRQELEMQLANTESWLAIVNRGMRQLDHWDQRVLELWYFQKLSLGEICQDLGVERSSLYRHRDAALKNLTLSMYGALES